MPLDVSTLPLFKKGVMRRVGARAAIALLVAAASGCSGTMQAYPGPKLPPAEIATVHGSIGFYGVASRVVTLRTIDGIEASERTAAVLPGAHTATVSYQASGGYVIFNGGADCAVTWTAEAGHDYQIDGSHAYQSWHCWLDDVQTNQRVHGGNGGDPGAASYSDPNWWK